MIFSFQRTKFTVGVAALAYMHIIRGVEIWLDVFILYHYAFLQGYKSIAVYRDKQFTHYKHAN